MTRLFPLFRSPVFRRRFSGAEASQLQSFGAAPRDRRFRALDTTTEGRFQSDTSNDQVRSLFRAALAAALIYNVQLIAEWALTPDAFPLSAALHFGLVTPALLLVAAFARAATSPLRRDLMGLAIPLCIAAQTAVTYFVSAAPGASSYVSLFAVLAILSNASLPLSLRASMWTTAVCLALMAIAARNPHGSHAEIGELIPLSLCALVTLTSSYQRNRERRRTYVYDQRQRLRLSEAGEEARHDALTGLANRRRLEEAAGGLWSSDSALVAPIAVILFDVDRFKAFNDIYGHQAGDEALKQVGACALAEVGAEDELAGRYGGEEFILLLPRTALEDARRTAERLRAAVAALAIPHAGSDERVVTASFGVACADSGRRSFEELTADADAALYRAKRAGRNRVIAAAPSAPKGPKAA